MTNNDFRQQWNATVEGKGFPPESFDRGLSDAERERVYQTAVQQALARQIVQRLEQILRAA